MNAQAMAVELPDLTTLILGVVESNLEQDFNYQIDVDQLASCLGLSHKTVEDSLKELEAVGYINRFGSVKWSVAIVTASGSRFAKYSDPIAVIDMADLKTVSSFERRGLKNRRRMLYVVDSVEFRLTPRMEHVLYGIYSFLKEHPDRFPPPNTMIAHLGDHMTSFRRAHMINSYQDLESLGLIARDGRKSWKEFGYVTEIGEAFFRQNPTQKRMFVPKADRVGGGVDPQTGGTRYPNQLVSVDDLSLSNLIPRADLYGKLGASVCKGRKKDRRIGMPIATFSLEEGRTCSAECGLLEVCFAGKMSQQKRVLYEGHKTDAAFAKAISEAEPHHYRLNTIGDFPTHSFVDAILASLAVSTSTAFGYTHWQPGTELGDQIRTLSDVHWDFFAVRTSYEHGSRDPLSERGAVTLETFDPELLREHNAFPCPYELPNPKVKNCGDCGLCWMTRKNVAFKLH